NALTGVANARFDCAPMLLISGAGPTATAGQGHFQDLDQVALARPITKFSASIDDAGRTLHMLDQAFATATAKPCGPVHLMFPMDVQKTELAGCHTAAPASVDLDDTTDLDKTTRGPDAGKIARALEAAKAPLVIAGSGIFYD